MHPFVKSLGGLPKKFYSVSVSSLLFQLPRFIIQPVLALYLLELGASLPEVGLILSIESIGKIILRIPLTLLTQRIGNSRMIKLSFIVQTSTYLFYYLAPSPRWFFIIPFFQILATGSFNQLALSEVTSIAPITRQGDAIGQYMTFMHAGQCIGPLITSALLIYSGYSRVFLVATLFPIIGLVLFLLAGFEDNIDKNSKEPSETVGGFEGLATLRRVIKEKDVRLLSLLRISFSLGSSIFTILFPVWLVSELQFSSSIVALLFSVLGFADAFIRIPFGRLADRIGAKKVLFYTYLLILFDYVLIAYSKNIYILGIEIFVYGACSGIRAVSEWTHLVSVIDPKIKTMSMSFLFNCFDFGTMLGSISAGFLTTVLPFQTLLLITALIIIPTIPAIIKMTNASNERNDI